MIRKGNLLETTVIIAAAGKSARWDNYLDTCKHLAPVDASGQTIIGRTVAMVKNSGIDNIFVATQSDKLIESVAKDIGVIRPANSEFLADTILSSRKKWTDRTIILLGDVFFSCQSLSTILGCRSRVKFFGIDRHGNPEFSKIKRSELYAFSFDSSAQDLIENRLTLNSTLARFRDCGGLRFSYLRMPLAKKLDCLKLLFHYSHPPKPPGLLIKAGFKRSMFWQTARFLLAKPRRTKVYGKLWGLYFTTAGIGLFDSVDYKRQPNDNDNNYFEEIYDMTHDIDTKEDYDILMEKLLRTNSA